MADQAPRDKNWIPITQAASNANDRAPVDLWADPTTHRLLVDIGSGGSGGTQYTDGAASVTHPIGNALVFDNGSSAFQAVNSTHGLPVNIVAGNITGFALDSSLTTIDTDLKSNITLHAGTNIIGKVTTDQTTHGTTDLVAADITKVGGASFALGQQLAAASLPIVLTASQLTTLTPPTNTGYALDATLTGGSQQTKLTNGTDIVGVLKNDGSIATTQNALITTGTFLSVAFTTTSAQAVGSTDVANYRSVSVQITGQGGSSTVNFQGSNDNSNWVGINLTNLNSSSVGTSTTGTGIFSSGLGYRYFRLNVTGIVSGTTAGTIVFSTLPPFVHAVGIAGTSTVSGNGNFNSAAVSSGFPMAANASSAVPSAVGADSREVQLWADRSGRLHVMGDAVAAANISNAFLMGVSDATNLQAVIQAANSLNSTGAGIPTAQIIGQFDDVSPTSITENQFGNLRMSANRNLYGTIRDAAGNERGVNVTSANALVVDGSAVTQPTAEVAPTSILNGKTTVTTSGIRVTLASSTTVKSVTIKALSTNTGIIYVGNSSVASTNGLQLQASESVSIDIANLNTVNIDSSVSGEGVTYIGVN